MRDYGKLECSFWRNLDIRAMSEDARWLAVYILTCQHGNILGCFCLPQSYVVDDLQWSAQRVSKAFIELFKNRFIIIDEKSEWLFIPKFLKWNRIENPNQGKFAVKVFNTIPNNLTIKSNLIKDLKAYSKHLPEQFRNSLETVVCVENNTTVTDTVIVKDIVIAPVIDSTKAEISIEAQQIGREFYDYIMMTFKGSKIKLDQQIEAAQKLIDKYSLKSLRTAIKVVQSDKFFAQNVRSLLKLDEHWEKRGRVWILEVLLKSKPEYPHPYDDPEYRARQKAENKRAAAEAR
jgi:hypothetical protein